MGLVSPEAIQSVVEPGAPPAQPPPATYSFPGAPPMNNTPPVGASSYPPPTQNNVPAYNAPAPAPPAAPPGQDTEALMRAVMELPQSQIDQLPEAERQQIMALRAQFGGARR